MPVVSKRKVRNIFNPFAENPPQNPTRDAADPALEPEVVDISEFTPRLLIGYELCKRLSDYSIIGIESVTKLGTIESINRIITFEIEQIASVKRHKSVKSNRLRNSNN